MKKSITLFLFLFTFFKLAAQFTESNLPIILITTDNGSDIPDDPKIGATMKIIFNGQGQRNYLTDQNTASSLNYNGRIGIETRGSTSQFFAKKPYSLTTLMADNKTNNNVSLLGMPKDNDWVLNALVYDSSSIRDYLSYNLSRAIGQYAPRTQYCEVVINNDYRGLYILQEKIKVGDNRVDISKIKATDNTKPDITGGYITKADKEAGQDVAAWKMSSYSNTDVNFIHEFPKPSVITSEQNQYIKSVFLSLSSASSDNSIANGYPSVIDIPSFIDFILINELSANVDAYQFSTYFHKDKNGKLRAGPLWDLNLSYGNDLKMWGLDRSKTNTWQFDNWDNTGAKFWKDLFTNSTFKCYLAKRWFELTQTGQPLNLQALYNYIDQTVAAISEANSRNNSKWSIIDAGEINGIKSFLSDRINWMNNNIGSSSACNNIFTPPLVITKINYHPGTSTEFSNSEDQEFIEITNNSNSTVATAGFYFSGTGFAYNFPKTVLPPNAVIQIANKRETFEQLYGYQPFGEFTRNLSNHQKLTLCDAFGNIIDKVEYSTDSPWPDADGNGSYIKLINIELNNNVGSNWVASTDAPQSNVITGIDEAESNEIEVFPNPASNVLTIKSSVNMNSLQLIDLQGRLLETKQLNGQSAVLKMNSFREGLYLVRIHTSQGVVIKKVLIE